MQLKTFLDKFDKIVTQAVTVIASVAMTVTCTVMLVQVLLRRVFNSPIVWAEDLSVFLFIWITFLGAAILFQKKTLSSVDTFVMLFSQKVRIIIEACVDLIVAVASWYLLKLSIDFMIRQQRLGHKLGGALGVPIWVVTIAVILSFALIILFGITSFIRKILLVQEIKGETE